MDFSISRSGCSQRYNSVVEHEEKYRGQRIVVTTMQQGGSWSGKADLVDESGLRSALVSEAKGGHPSEEEARRAALSLAVEALDRGRTSKGKP